MSKFLRSTWLIGLLGAVLFLAGMVIILRSQNIVVARPNASDPDHAQDPHKPPPPPWDTHNPELHQLLEELKAEKTQLAQREKELQELSTRLQSERAELTQTTQTVFRLQREFDQSVVRLREEEVANLKKLAKIYATMTPEGAVAVIKEMDDDQLVKFLVFMKEDESAPILEAFAKLGDVEAKRIAKISERIRLSLHRHPITNTNPAP
jgi:flagellar motility protein MotE (MotC chaperone)